MLVTMTVLMVVAATGANEAEDLFKKMEAQVHAAKNLEFESTTLVEGTNKASMSLKATLAQGNKARFTLSITSGGKNTETATIISDGKNTRQLQGEKPGKMEETPKNLTVAFSTLLTRVGMLPMGRKRDADDPFKADKFDKDKLVTLSHFKLGKKEKLDERETQVIDYQATMDGGEGQKLNVTVWIDTKTNLPVKRVLTMMEREQTITFTETIKTFKVSDKVDDKHFELPKQ